MIEIFINNYFTKFTIAVIMNLVISVFFITKNLLNSYGGLIINSRAICRNDIIGSNSTKAHIWTSKSFAFLSRTSVSNRITNTTIGG